MSLAQFFRSYLWLIVGSCMAGAVIGLVVSLIVQPNWTARMTIQVGQIQAAEGKGPAIPIGTALSGVERLSEPSFKLAVLKRLGIKLAEDARPESQLAFSSLRASPAKALDMINVQVSRRSPEEAEKTLNAVWQEYSMRDQALFDTTMARLKTALADTQSDIAAIKKRLAEGNQALDTGAAQGDMSTRGLLLGNIASLSTGQLVALQERELGLESALDPLRSYPTRLVGEVYTPLKPSSPVKSLYVAGGFALGLLLSLLVALARATFSGGNVGAQRQ